MHWPHSPGCEARDFCTAACHCYTKNVVTSPTQCKTHFASIPNMRNTTKVCVHLHAIMLPTAAQTMPTSKAHAHLIRCIFTHFAGIGHATSSFATMPRIGHTSPVRSLCTCQACSTMSFALPEPPYNCHDLPLLDLPLSQDNCQRLLKVSL